VVAAKSARPDDGGFQRTRFRHPAAEEQWEDPFGRRYARQ
jgi:hypothetical protein